MVGAPGGPFAQDRHCLRQPASTARPTSVAKMSCTKHLTKASFMAAAPIAKPEKASPILAARLDSLTPIGRVISRTPCSLGCQFALPAERCREVESVINGGMQ